MFSIKKYNGFKFSEPKFKGGGLGGVTSKISSVVKPVAGLAGGVLGDVLGGITGDIGKVQQADQTRIIEAIDQIKKQREQSQQILNEQRGLTKESLGGVNNSLSLLQAAASGQAPSQAQGVLQQGLDQAINAQAALANSGSMANQLVRQRQAADTGAQLAQQTANQAGILRAQEMAAARSAYNQGAQNLYGTNVGAGQSTQGILGNLATGQANAAQQAAALQQQALTATGQNQAAVAGGLLGGVGGALATKAYKGTKVPGEANVDGDSPKNDTKPYLLSPGEIVIPRSAAKSMKSAVEFLEKYIEKNGEKD